MNYTGCNLREALIHATQLGCEVEYVNRTGEVRVYLPGHRSVRLNGRRKDAPRALTTLLNQIERGL
jgi:hypothetical protein